MIEFKIMKTNKKILKHILSLSCFLLILSLFTYFGLVDTAFAIDDPLTVTLNVTSGIAISSPSDVLMSRNLTLANMTAIGTSTWTVTTNNVTGYNLTIKATSSPAMISTVGSSSVANYQTGAPNTWSVTAGTAAFGFSVFGPDTPTATWGTGALCSGTPDQPSTSLKYMGFTTTTSTPVLANRSTTTPFAGIATTVCFAVEQDSFFIPTGTYTATIVATAVTI